MRQDICRLREKIRKHEEARKLIDPAKVAMLDQAELNARLMQLSLTSLVAKFREVQLVLGCFYDLELPVALTEEYARVAVSESQRLAAMPKGARVARGTEVQYPISS